MRDIIVFGEDFGGLPSSTQHLITRLAATRKVLWVNSIGLRQPKMNWRDIKRALGKLLGISKSGYNQRSLRKSAFNQQNHLDVNLNNLKVVNLITIPAPSSFLARQVAKIALRWQLKAAINELNLQQPILWSSLPTAADLCGELGESAVVYYCGDDFSSLAGVDHHVVSRHEDKLVKRADLILAASAKLLTKFPQHKAHYLPHGVDADLFSTPVARAPDLPCKSAKIAGFYGSLSNWLDYDLIKQVCLANPDWQFVFIGPIELQRNPLPQLANVRYLGPKPHHVLPSYSQHWDVSLLPFKANAQIASCSPLKLLEYLAAGRPVIATPFPALSRYREQVSVVNNAQQLNWALKELAEHGSTKSTVSSKHSFDHSFENESWDRRARQLHQLLEAL